MGAVTRFPIPLLVAIVYVVVMIFLFNAALPGATVVLVLVGLVVVLPYLLMAKTMANNRRFDSHPGPTCCRARRSASGGRPACSPSESAG